MNQILLQLQEADRFACAKNPHYRRLAVVLLDNLIELQLVRKAELEFAFDDHRSEVRQYNMKLRRDVTRRHPALLHFAKRLQWISEDDVLLLSLAHEVRNGFYHQGNYDKTDAEIAIRLLYRFVKEKFPKWKTCIGIYAGAHGTIDAAEAANDEDGNKMMRLDGVVHEFKQFEFPSGNEEYWTKAIDAILTYQPSEDIRPLVYAKGKEIVLDMERDLEFISENAGDNCLDILISRFGVFTYAFSELYLSGTKIKNPMYAVNIYMSLLNDEERLLDIEDLDERAIECHKVMDAHQHNPDPMPRSLLKKYGEQVEKILAGTEAQGIARFLQIKNDLGTVSKAIREFSRDLEGYRQED